MIHPSVKLLHVDDTYHTLYSHGHKCSAVTGKTIFIILKHGVKTIFSVSSYIARQATKWQKIPGLAQPSKHT